MKVKLNIILDISMKDWDVVPLKKPWSALLLSVGIVMHLLIYFVIDYLFWIVFFCIKIVNKIFWNLTLKVEKGSL